MIQRVTILGPGLLGGSIALAIQAQRPEIEVVLWGRREQPVALAQSLGLSLATTDFSAAVADSDLCILATPVGVMGQMVEKLLAEPRTKPLLLTDVGSVKRLPHAVIEPMVEGSMIRFVGSHPMAGSENAGMEAARVDLLTGATCLLTNEAGVAQELVAELDSFWRSLGCVTRAMSAEDHDYAVARVSHFPHLLASVGATVGLAFEDIADLCGGGMRDTTRVAAGDPELWTEIVMENRDALHRSLRESIGDLVKLMDLLEKEDRGMMLAYLQEAQRRRQLI